jgi:deoxyribonuclease V
VDIQLHQAHAWDVPPEAARQIQQRLAGLVREEPLAQPIRTVAGIDMGVRGDRVQAAAVVVQLPDLAVVDAAVWQGLLTFPYVPGLLSFREVPPALHALARLSIMPDVLMTDGQGRAHPRRCGLACHLGVLLDRPTLGVAKSLLVGTFAPPGPDRGSHAPLLHRHEVVGAVLRTRANVQPVYVSVGHRITLDEAVSLTLACTGRYRLPEPTRQAHLRSQF